ncbi:hypothetical protein ACVWWD_003044 [Mesorhizobium sp. URHB0026]
MILDLAVAADEADAGQHAKRQTKHVHAGEEVRTSCPPEVARPNRRAAADQTRRHLKVARHPSARRSLTGITTAATMWIMTMIGLAFGGASLVLRQLQPC